MEITKSMYLLAKKIVSEYENNQRPKINFPKVGIEQRKREFYNSLIVYLEIYSKEMIKDFYEYWTEHGEKDRKFRKEKEKSFNLELRLKTWNKRSKNFKSTNTKPEKKNAGQIIREKYNL